MNAARNVPVNISDSYSDHTCLVLAGGGLQCFGSNTYGQLGCGDTTVHPTPVNVVGVSLVAAVVTGQSFTCALLAVGSVQCWGYNAKGQLGNNRTVNSVAPVNVTGIDSAVAIAAGESHVCVILANTSLACWGRNDWGLLGLGFTNTSGCQCYSTAMLVPGLSGVVSVAGGQAHTCAVLASGLMKCWGYNAQRQLGTSTTGNAPSPMDVLSITTARSVVSGWYHNCVLLANSSVQCFGWNTEGQLGDGLKVNTPSTVAVVGITDAVAVSVGAYFSCALLQNGTVRCWGQNVFGQLGTADNVASLVPVTVLGATGVTAISAGFAHVCALLLGGALSCWGSNSDMQLGRSTQTLSSVPVAVTSDATDTQISLAAGCYHTCRLFASGSVQCWGWNQDGRLGNGLVADSRVPVNVSGINDAVSLSAGCLHACVLRQGGVVSCWGQNTYGQLGNNSAALARSNIPLDVPSVSGLTSFMVAGGYAHTFVQLLNGSFVSWGRNDYGQLAFGYMNSTDVKCAPALASVPPNVTSLSVGHWFTCALLFSGAVHCVGVNAVGQLGRGNFVTPALSFAPVVGLQNATVSLGCAFQHSCAVLADARVACWGSNSYGEMGGGSINVAGQAVPVVALGVTGAVGVSCGHSHSCAVLASGTVSCWGQNVYGQLGATPGAAGVPVAVSVPGITTAVSVVLGEVHSCALLASGSVLCWGDNRYGQLGSLSLDTQYSNVAPVPVILPSVSPSPSVTPTATQTASGTCTGTATESVTSTATATGTVTVTVTTTVSPSSSVTATDTATVTGTCSASSTGTFTPTVTVTPTVTTTGTVSASASRTPTDSQLPTASGTPSTSSSVSVTTTATVTLTRTTTPSVTSTSTSSATPTVTPTVTVTATVTASPSSTASVTPSLSVTPSSSVTPSASASADVPLLLDSNALALSATGGSSQAQIVHLRVSKAVLSWRVELQQSSAFSDAAWLSVSGVTSSSFVVTAATAALCGTDGVFRAVTVVGAVVVSASVDGWSAAFSVSLPVTFTVLTPLAEVVPLLVSHVFTSKLSSAQAAVVSVTNDGNIPLHVNCSVGNPSSLLTLLIQPPSLSVPPGQSASITFLAEANGAPSDVYAYTAVLATNQVSCSAEVVSFAIPWTVRVLDVLLFPAASMLTLSPDALPPPLSLSLANFGGEAVQCTLAFTDECAAFTSSDAPVVHALAAGELWAYSMQPHYPLASAQLSCNVSAACSRTSDGSAMPVQRASVTARRVKGAPIATACLAAFTVPAVVRVGAVVTVVLHARDRVGNTVTDMAVLGTAVAANVAAATGLGNNGTGTVSLPMLTQRIVNDTLFVFDVVVAVPVLNASVLLLAISMDGAPVPNASVWLHLDAVACPTGMVVDSATATCVCERGQYTNATLAACLPCPAGSFQPLRGNVTGQRCLPCTTGWYCVSGSAVPTAECPADGFDCSAGVLRVRQGFWLHRGPELLQNTSLLLSSGTVNFTASRCPNRDACPSTDGRCAEGYTDAACVRCARGYTGLQLRCFQQLAMGGSGMFLLLWMALVVVFLAAQVTLLCEERGVQRQRQVWVNMHGMLLASELQQLCDGLQIMALQVLMPSQLSSVFFQSALWLAGGALGPGTWPPTVQLFSSRWAAMWFPVYLFVAVVAAAVPLSLLLATPTWKRQPQRPLHLVTRARTAARLLAWIVYPAFLWALSSGKQPLWLLGIFGYARRRWLLLCCLDGRHDTLLLCCRSAPFLLLALHAYTAKRGVALVNFTAYDVFVFCQKLAPCMLPYSAWQAYGSTLFTLTLTLLAFLAWLRLRVKSLHGSKHSRSAALVQFSCVFGLQAYVLIGEARWFNAAVVSPVDRWRHGFHVAMFVYLVGGITWCIARVCLRWYWIVRGPLMAKRQVGALHKTTLSQHIWVDEMASYAAPRNAGADASTMRHHRVASISNGRLPPTLLSAAFE